MALFLHRVLLFVAVLTLGVGCSSPRQNATASPTPKFSNIEADFSQLAAKLANDECERLWGQRPFTSDLYKPRFQDGSYSWGHLDPAGPGGFSALVTFKPDGKDPQVKVWLHANQPDKIILNLDHVDPIK